MKYRIYPDGEVYHEDEFAELDNTQPYCDDYSVYDIPEELENYFGELGAQDALFRDRIKQIKRDNSLMKPGDIVYVLRDAVIYKTRIEAITSRESIEGYCWEQLSKYTTNITDGLWYYTPLGRIPAKYTTSSKEELLARLAGAEVKEKI